MRYLPLSISGRVPAAYLAHGLLAQHHSKQRSSLRCLLLSSPRPLPVSPGAACAAQRGSREFTGSLTGDLLAQTLRQAQSILCMYPCPLSAVPPPLALPAGQLPPSTNKSPSACPPARFQLYLHPLHYPPPSTNTALLLPHSNFTVSNICHPQQIQVPP